MKHLELKEPSQSLKWHALSEMRQCGSHRGEEDDNFVWEETAADDKTRS